VHDAEELGPRSDCLAVLVRHAPRDLVMVSQVVRRPGGEQLAERDRAENRMGAATVKCRGGEIESAQGREVLAPETRELVEQLVERLPGARPLLREAIVAIERTRLAVLEDDAGARDPVGLLAVDQVPDHVEGAERLRPFGAARPCVGQAAQHRVERRGGALEHGGRCVQRKLHRDPSWSG